MHAQDIHLSSVFLMCALSRTGPNDHDRTKEGQLLVLVVLKVVAIVGVVATVIIVVVVVAAAVAE